jgi:threonine synthase
MISHFVYQCVNCGKEYSTDNVMYLCPDCKNYGPELPPKGVLKICYDYDKLKREGISFDQLRKSSYIRLLPIKSIESLPPLIIGNTPLYQINQIENKPLPFNLFLKDDSQNPTFSFKDRASSLVSAFAKEHGFKIIITASTGNAGSSIAGICAAQGQRALVLVPVSAPVAKLTQIILYGASIIPIDGTYDDAFDLSIEATNHFGWYNRNTAFNPITVEGKKVVAFELFEQMNKTLPDRIFVPVGDGVIISGVYKGFEDLLKLNIIQKMPTIVAVQAEGSDNLIRNLLTNTFQSKPSQTIADSISVDFPRNFFMTKNFIHRYQGELITVNDVEILHASSHLAKNTGIFSEPAAAAAYAGFYKFQKEGKITSQSKNVVLLTGSGLKDIQSVKPLVKLPPPVQPKIEEIKKLIWF